MIAFPNAKINLGLNVVSRRADGFHNIETIFYPVGLKDVLEIIVAPDKKFSFTSSGLEIPGNPKNNLCIKALEGLAAECRILPVNIHLHKVIPMGSGLGGGSSDGAFTLKLLKSLFSLDLTEEKLTAHARKLGSDCAFFIRNRPLLATEKGDVFSETALTLMGYKILLVVPDIHVDTTNAYRMIFPKIPGFANGDLVNKPVSTWKDFLVNDFELPVFQKYPEIKELKSKIYSLGAEYASMSGSGSAVYGLFKQDLQVNPEFRNCFVWMERSR